MTPSPRAASRWRATAVIAVLILLSATGCQSRAGTAAFFGATRVSDDQVRQVAAEGQRSKAIQQGAGDVGGYRRLILGRLVRHLAVTGAARKLGVSVSEGKVDQAVTTATQQLGGSAQVNAALAGKPYFLPPSQLRPFLRDSVTMDQIGQRLTANQTFTEAELKKFYDDNGGAQSGQTFAQLRTRVLAAVRQQRGAAAAQSYVRTYAQSQRVTVNPRYGRFDAKKLFDANDAPSIVANSDDLVRDSGATAS